MIVKHLEAVTTLRPKRNAFLIPSNLIDRKFAINYIIPLISSYWGGSYSFLLPIKEESIASIEEWLVLLRKFDPDKIFSMGQFSEEFRNQIEARTLCGEIFQYNKDVGDLVCTRRNHIENPSLEEILNRDVEILEFAPSESEIHNLWFYSNYGRVGHYKKKFTDKEIKVTEHQLSVENIFDLESNSPFDNGISKDKGALDLTLQYLGNRGARDYFSEYNNPRILILGDSLEDWMLFQTLKSMYFLVSWYPISLLAKERISKQRSLNYRLIKELQNKYNKKVILTSTSLTEDEINILVKNTQEKSPFHSHKNITLNIEIQLKISNLFNNWIIWGELRNKSERLLIFENDLSVNSLPSLTSVHFPNNDETCNFVNDCFISNFSLVGNNALKNLYLTWGNDKNLVDDDVRINYLGGITFNPIPPLRLSGQDISSIARGPKVKAPTFIHALEGLFKKRELKISESIGTKNIRSCLSLWESSIEDFVADYFENDTSIIFKTFKLGKKAIDAKIVTDKNRIRIRESLFLTLPFQNAFQNKISTLTDDKISEWLNKGIIVRGQKLECTSCGRIDFYGFQEISKIFICHRCHSSEKLSESTMGMLEPKFVYNMSPLIFGLQEHHSDFVIKALSQLKKMSKKNFQWCAELIIYDSAGKELQEIDLICNIDGKLAVVESKKANVISDSQLDRYFNLCKNFNFEIMYFFSESGWSDPKKSAIISKFEELKGLEVIFN